MIFVVLSCACLYMYDLALNSSKSESILFGTRQRLRNFPLVSTPTIAGSRIPFSDNIKPWV